MNRLILLAVLITAAAVTGFAQTEADRDAIKRTALNYAEGWYEGNAGNSTASGSSLMFFGK